VAGIIDLESMRSTAGTRRDGVDRLLALRDRRRALEKQVDALEHELRGQVVALEDVRRAESKLESQLQQSRAELDGLQQRTRERMARAHEVRAEFEQVKQEVLTLHHGRTVAERELGHVDDEIRRQAEQQRRLWHECRESTTDLAQLRRVLGGVLDEVKHVLSRRSAGGG
jgi:chromosome segregation ATPase